MSSANISYTLSLRGKQELVPILSYLCGYYVRVPVERVDSVFGFVEQSTLYGGRPFREPELSPDDVDTIYEKGIGLRLPLTNHTITREEYEAASPFLTKYHRPGNTAIVTNDEFAQWLREDYPQYRIEASAIKNLDSLKKISKALELYDTVVPPAKANDDLELLAEIPDKSRIRLFLNAGCAHNCPSKMCYPAVSEMNKYQGAQFRCSQPIIKREVKMHDFDLDGFIGMGFTKFKLLRAGPVTAY